MTREFTIMVIDGCLLPEWRTDISLFIQRYLVDVGLEDKVTQTYWYNERDMEYSIFLKSEGERVNLDELWDILYAEP